MAKAIKSASHAILRPTQITPYQGTGTVVESSLQTRPFWFNGRFLAARDLQRDQDFFLTRQAKLGTAAGFGVIHGLQVTVPSDAPADAETFVIAAGQGLTPGGYLVMLDNDLTVVLSDLADAEDLDAQFGISESPTPVARTRTGLFIVALRPVEFTANPITSYPVSIQGTRTTHDGNTVEATAVSLLPFPDPASNFDAGTKQAALARSIFLLDSSGPVSDSLLPLAMISIQGGVIEWIDQWMVRRDSGPEFPGLRFTLNDTPTQQAFLLQYDAQLLQLVNGLTTKSPLLPFPATDYFQALPPCGRFPLVTIDTTRFTQLFFPPQTNVTLSLVPDDELPALIEDSMSLPPIDLTQQAAAFADLSVFVLVPVPRQQYNSLAASLPPVALTGAVPQVLNNRRPTELLKFFRGPVTLTPPPAPWTTAIGTQTYGYYIVRRSVPIFVSTTTIAFVSVPGAASGSFQLTASVSPQTATGTVTFMDGATSLGEAALAQGSGTLSVTGLTTGTHELAAVYSGDTYFATSTSATVVETV